MRRKGQSTLEYAIILAVIIGVIVLVGRGLFSTKLTDSLNAASNRIGTESSGLAK
jgi:hypothetical protein